MKKLLCAAAAFVLVVCPAPGQSRQLPVVPNTTASTFAGNDSRIVKAVRHGGASDRTIRAAGVATARISAARAADVARPEDYACTPLNARSAPACHGAADPDDTRSLQRAANTGKMVRLLSGKTYTTCATVTGLRFTSDGTATIKACADPPGPSSFSAFITNPNSAASSIIDRNAIVSGIVFDGSNIPFLQLGEGYRGGFHAVRFRMVEHVRESDLTCHNVGDCTANLASDDVIVENSYADGVVNAGFDFWDGPTNALAQNNTIHCAANVPTGSQGYGVLFSAASTTYADRAAVNVTSRGNKVFGACQAGIFNNQLSAGSSTTNFVSDGDFIDCRGTKPAHPTQPIGTTGNVNGAHILHPTIRNCGFWNNGTPTGNTAVGATPDGLSGTPNNVEVISPDVSNTYTAGGNYALFELGGTKISLSNPRVDNCGYVFEVYYTDTKNYFFAGQFAVGTSGSIFTRGGGAGADAATCYRRTLQSRPAPLRCR